MWEAEGYYVEYVKCLDMPEVMVICYEDFVADPASASTSAWKIPLREASCPAWWYIWAIFRVLVYTCTVLCTRVCVYICIYIYIYTYMYVHAHACNAFILPHSLCGAGGIDRNHRPWTLLKGATSRDLH